MKVHFRLLTISCAALLCIIVFGSNGFAYETYDLPRVNFAYDSAIVYYPSTGSGPFPATTMSGGWTNTKEDMEWICEDLVDAGFIVICFTPQRRYLALPWIWKRGQVAAYEKLVEENSNRTSPIYGMVNTNKIGIAGFSMGGGGVVNTAQDNATDAKVAIAMAPWETCTLNPLSDCLDYTDNISIPIFIFGGTNDRLVYDNELNNMYETLPARTEKIGAIYEGMNHFDMFGVELAKGENRFRVATYMIAFLKVYLVNDSTYLTFLSGNQLMNNIDDGWFAMYKYNDVDYVPYQE